MKFRARLSFVRSGRRLTDDTAMAAQERAKGVCPECGRTVSGRAVGIESDHGDRRFVALAPHTRGRQGHGRDRECLPRFARRVVPRLRD